MKILNALAASLRLRADSGGVQFRPDSDVFYQQTGYQTATGLRVSPESAMRVAAVYACVRVIAETVASLPLIIYKILPDGSKVRAPEHPLYHLLHDEPNDWQTSYEFIEMMQAHLELRGNAFARIVPGPNGAIDQLIPLHPDRVAVYRMPSGELRYQVRYFYTAQIEHYRQDEMFHLRGLSSDGLVGLSTIGVGAETVAVGMAAQEYAGRFFENDTTPNGVLIHPKTLGDPAYERIKKSWRESLGGLNQHSMKILEEDMKYQHIGLTNKDSQLLEARQFSRGDIASLFRVPPHKIGDLSRATFSNIEQQNIEFATDAVRPRLVRLERRINMTLLDPLDLDQETIYFAEFEMDALMRGDMKSTYEALSVGINAGFLTRADARVVVGKNPIPGLEKPLMPFNLAVVDDAGNPQPIPKALPAPEDGTGTEARAARKKEHQLQKFIDSAAGRVVRKEAAALRRMKSRAATLDAFKAEAAELFTAHGAYVQEVMHVSDFAAAWYVSQRMASVEGATDATVDAMLNEWESGSAVLAELASTEYLSSCKEREDEERGDRVQVNVTTPAVNVAPPSVTVVPEMKPMQVVIEQKAKAKIVTATRDPKTGAISATVQDSPEPMTVTKEGSGVLAVAPLNRNGNNGKKS